MQVAFQAGNVPLEVEQGSPKGLHVEMPSNQRGQLREIHLLGDPCCEQRLFLRGHVLPAQLVGSGVQECLLLLFWHILPSDGSFAG